MVDCGGKEGHRVAKELRLPSLPLAGCFRLLPLNHAAAHDAVKAPQVEEGNGPKQPHGDDLEGRRLLSTSAWRREKLLSVL